MDYTKLIVKAVQDVPPSGIRKYFDILTDKTISLGVGEPDFPTPEAIRREALERLSHGRIPYSSNSGMPELRELIASTSMTATEYTMRRTVKYLSPLAQVRLLTLLSVRS